MRLVTPLTVIVPTLNEAAHIRRVLRRQRDESGVENLQILIVDGGSNDDTVVLARPFGHVLHSAPGRAEQLNVGLRHARGDIVLFCHGDTLLPPQFGRAVQEALTAPTTIGGAFRPTYHPPHPFLFLLEQLLRIPSSYLMFGDQAIFARRPALEAIGGVPPLALMEDVALVMALRQRGGLARLPLPVRTSSRRLLERGVIRQLLLDAWLLFSYHLLKEDPTALADRYHVTDRDRPHRRGTPLQRP